MKEVKMEKDFKRLFKLLVRLLVIVLVITPIVLNTTILKGAAQPGSILRIGLMGATDPLNPNETTTGTTREITPQIFESLIDARSKPLLATSWKVTPDGMAIVFSLRKGVRFHDGTPFDARAVKVTFDRMKNEKLKRWAVFQDLLKSVEVIDENTVKMNLICAPAIMLNMLSVAPLIECPAAIEKYGKEVVRHPVGTGPFKFFEEVPDQRIVLHANKDYWGGEPKISQVIFKPVPDEATRTAMLEAGDLDIATGLPYAAVERLRSNPAIKLDTQEGRSVLFIMFNTPKKPFDDKRVRQAIAYSIDRKSIVKVLLFGYINASDTYAAPLVEQVIKYDIYPYNPDKGKKILTDLGWKLGKSGFLEKDGEVFRTSIVATSGRYPMDRQICEAMQAQLKRVGIDLRVTIVDLAALVKAGNLDRTGRQNAEFGMLMFLRPMGPNLHNAFITNIHSAAIPPRGTNISYFANSEVDRALEEAVKTTDEGKRGALYKKAQDILNEEIPMLPIYADKNFLGLRKGVKGVAYTAENPWCYLYISPAAQVGQ